MIEPLLAIRDLRVNFTADEGEVEAVAGVSLDLPPNRTVAVVGGKIDAQIADRQQRLDHRPSPNSAPAAASVARG